MTSVHLTPSNPYYAKNLRSWMSKCLSWEEG